MTPQKMIGAGVVTQETLTTKNLTLTKTPPRKATAKSKQDLYDDEDILEASEYFGNIIQNCPTL